jgi:hypothetical protein
LCGYSRTSQHFMEPEGSLSCSQEASTGLCLEPNQSTPYHPIHFIHFILSTHLCFGLPSDLFMIHALSISLYLAKSTNYEVPQSPITSSLFSLSIFLSTLFSKTLSLYSSRNVSDRVLHPYTTTGKIIVLYILLFMFLDSRREDKRFWITMYSNC